MIKCDACGVNLGASNPYLPVKFDVSSSQVKSKAPFGLVANGIELSIIEIASRFYRRC